MFGPQRRWLNEKNHTCFLLKSKFHLNHFLSQVKYEVESFHTHAKEKA